MGLSRQFRDKEYFTFDITTSGSYGWDISQNNGSIVRTKVDNQTFDSTGSVNGVSSSAGTYEMELWARELSNLNKFDFSNSNFSSIGPIDFSDCNYLHTFKVSQTVLSSLTLPTTIKSGSIPLTFYSDRTLGLPTILDLSQWTDTGIEQMYIRWSGVERLILPSNNPGSGTTRLYHDMDATGTVIPTTLPIRAIGPGAATGNVIDLSSQKFAPNADLILGSATLNVIAPIAGSYSSIVWPTSWGSGTIGEIGLFGSSCTTIDLSSVKFEPSAKITLSAQTLLTSFIKPSVIEGAKVDHLNFARSNVLTSLDIDTLTNLSFFKIWRSWNLTSLTFPSTTASISYVHIEWCFALGYIDFTVMPNLTDINGSFLMIRNNYWSTSVVNQILEDLDTISSGGYTSRHIFIEGTNAAPDGSSGGFNGTLAVTNLIAKGFTVTTS